MYILDKKYYKINKNGINMKYKVDNSNKNKKRNSLK